jgi:3D (Asp-Asp-Asp) domain-containing protein
MFVLWAWPQEASQPADQAIQYDSRIPKESLKPGEKRLILEVEDELLDIVVKGQTVREALAELGIELRPGDQVFPPAEALVTDGSYVTYARRLSVPIGAAVALAYTTSFESDGTLPVGARSLRQAGRAGEARAGVSGAYEITKDVAERVVGLGARGAAPASGYWSGAPVLKMDATAYYWGPECIGPGATGNAASGVRAGYGIVAVDRTFIPLGTRLYVEGYGYAVAADTGSAIKGNRIDLCFDDYALARSFGHQMVDVYVLD